MNTHAFEPSTKLQRRRIQAADARATRAVRRAETAEARAAEVERRMSAMLHSKAWRVTWPLRVLSSALHRQTPPPASPIPAAQPEVRETAAPVLAVIVDDNWPRPDRDAGSIEIVNLADSLRTLGLDVRVAVDESRCSLAAADAAAARAALAARGITPMPFADTAEFDRFLQGEGKAARLFVLCRVYCGGARFKQVRACCPGSRIIFNTIDLHYLRIAREAEMTGDPALKAAAASTRQREEFLSREADATFVVSDAEREALESAVPDANVWTLPLARPVQPSPPPFSARSGIGFIGGFAHSPNLDAVRFFLQDVWPLVLREWPDCRFAIVGADLPQEALAGAPGAVEYLGPVPDAGPWFDSLLLTVAPLRFGAGVKGKVVSSMAAGVPCVLTGIAAEGMGLRDGTDALIADDPAQMARQILRLRDDRELWSSLGANGLAHIATAFSPDAWRAKLRDALWTIDALPSEQPER